MFRITKLVTTKKSHAAGLESNGVASSIPTFFWIDGRANLFPHLNNVSTLAKLKKAIELTGSHLPEESRTKILALFIIEQ